ncbi:LOW QUALITY PROTEIN: hypothetical protein Dda_4370 [Drechslerella dactyloides]|uniref:Glycosyltransferase family 15 protein n=1 Tax=Drechslerella dactyloides TaxID=74499 RepID=A0AAD6IXG7_DREDA|nr:LOW QUALITY PROTEIN: hypothetical protein Dda_4370 [Drechslerella dactyloides]
MRVYQHGVEAVRCDGDGAAARARELIDAPQTMVLLLARPTELEDAGRGLRRLFCYTSSLPRRLLFLSISIAPSCFPTADLKLQWDPLLKWPIEPSLISLGSSPSPSSHRRCLWTADLPSTMYGDRSPISPSFTQNPFDKYNTARTMLPEGTSGIGVGSWDRSPPRQTAGERRRIARVLVGLVLFGLVTWFIIGTRRTATELYGHNTDPAVESKPHHDSIASSEDAHLIGIPPAVVNTPHTPASSSSSSSSSDNVQVGKEKASFVMLIRNQELEDALKSMKQIEDRFNHKYHYPWTFLNDVPFTDEFIRETTKRASGKTEYGLIPKEHWSIPDAIDQVKMRAAMNKMEQDKVIYGGSLSYRHMCRFNSGFFWRQELLDKYEWYWRVEPGIGFYCDVDYDPFEFMRVSGKKYGFVMALPEYKSTIPTLWGQTLNFMRENPKYLNSNSSLQFLLEDNDQGKTLGDRPGPEYNGCHFWSNFEIASLDLWRSEAYGKYFDHLDKAGGFFYERWGDAPVHSIAAALFLGTQEIHHFADMGCPQPQEFHRHAKCVCPFELKDSFDLNDWSCQPRWWKIAGKEYGA